MEEKTLTQGHGCGIEGVGGGGHSKNTYELLNVRALKFQPVNKIHIFNVWVRYFVWNFKGTLWNSTQNI